MKLIKLVVINEDTDEVLDSLHIPRTDWNDDLVSLTEPITDKATIAREYSDHILHYIDSRFDVEEDK